MEKRLLLSDCHLKPDRVEKIVKAEDPDKIICLGDYFDPKGNTPTIELWRETARSVKKWLYDPRFTLLLGNHDTSYCASNRCLTTGNWSCEAQDIVDEFLTPDDWAKFKLYYWLDDWLITHAGLHANYRALLGEDLKKGLEAAEVEARKTMNTGDKPHWFFNVGYCRGGWASWGGITWCDFEDEFSPVPGLKQIFGHTVLDEPHWRASMGRSVPNSQFKWEEKDWNLALDTRLNHYAVYDGKTMVVKAYADL
jgi:hypothetical protein